MIKERVYLNDVFLAAPRLINQLNKLQGSCSRGSFHRSFWHHKTFDFSSSIYQMGCHSLALLFNLNLKDNPYYHQKAVREWIISGFQFALNLQKKEGSFDEWYPNERGWAGPTGYLMHSLYETYQMLKDEFPKELEAEFIKKMRLSANYLIKNEEPDVLANHYAIALLPIYEAYLLTNDPILLEGYEKLFNKFKSFFCEDEGWFLEYDGFDIGYLGATISFLARIHKLNSDPRILEMVGSALNFFANFCCPDFSLCGSLGSRQTVHLYPFGFEYWSEHFPIAKRISRWILEGMDSGNHVRILDQDDHYQFYRFPEYIEAFNESQHHLREAAEIPLPFEGEKTRSIFPKAGILIDKSIAGYVLINFKKGGALVAYSLKTQKCIMFEMGWSLERSNGELVSSHWVDQENKISIDQNKMTIEGLGHSMFNRDFSPIKWILFRIVMLLFGGSTWSSIKLKKLIRSTLMIKRKKTSIKFVRSIQLGDTGIALSESVSTPVKIRSFFWGGHLPYRYVPQSRYFLKSDLDWSTEELAVGDTNRGASIDIHKEARF